MKKTIPILAILTSLHITSCSHNASILGVGTAFRLGSGEVSLNYADGLFLNSVSRDNVRFTAELDSTIGVSYDLTSNTYKGIKGISYEVGPQLGGYPKGRRFEPAGAHHLQALAKQQIARFFLCQFWGDFQSLMFVYVPV